MSDPATPELPEFSAEPPPPPPLPPERVPFWGYHDLLLFVGLFVGSLVAAFFAVNGVVALLRIDVKNDLWRLLPAQFLAYFFLFLCLCLLFRAQYNRPFWRSLG